jgi:hypothetical protein
MSVNLELVIDVLEIFQLGMHYDKKLMIDELRAVPGDGEERLCEMLEAVDQMRYTQQSARLRKVATKTLSMFEGVSARARVAKEFNVDIENW